MRKRTETRKQPRQRQVEALLVVEMGSATARIGRLALLRLVVDIANTLRATALSSARLRLEVARVLQKPACHLHLQSSGPAPTASPP